MQANLDWSTQKPSLLPIRSRQTFCTTFLKAGVVERWYAKACWHIRTDDIFYQQ